MKDFFFIPKDCTNGRLIANGICNDETNNAECEFDGGECCGSYINTDYCTNCSCIGNGTGIGVFSDLIGNGYCDDEMNIAEKIATKPNWF